jgi:hypothetical protein
MRRHVVVEAGGGKTGRMGKHRRGRRRRKDEE